MIEFGVILATLIALLTCIAISLLMFHALFYVPLVPTEKRVIKKIAELADLKDGETVYDLGCGDGRVIEALAQEKKITAIGVDVSRIIICLAKIRRLWKKSPIQLLRKNFFDQDLSDADVVFCYLFPRFMKKLQEKFERELKPGARVISYSFPMIEWKALKTLSTREKSPKHFLLYRYDVPDAFHHRSK